MAQSLIKGTRGPAQAGRFYDREPDELRARIEAMIGTPAADEEPPPRILIAPHAGHIYSGRIAGAAYRQVAGRRIDRVAILAPSHYHYEDLDGGGLASAGAWRTPLGEIPVDSRAAELLLQEPGFCINDAAFDPEHSVEVHLPFLQVAIPGSFSILPVLFGKPVAAGIPGLAAGLKRVIEAWQQESLRWLIVASSDTYHGEDGEMCRENNEKLAHWFERFDPAALGEAFGKGEVTACGWVPIVVAMEAGRALGARSARAIARADSREVTGERGGYVVGYFAGMIR